MSVFWDKGYEATSTEDLLQAMGIKRQSMYAAFGDKHGLYLEALERYHAQRAAGLVERLRAGGSPLAGLQEVLVAIACETPEARARGCMGVSAIAERAHVDPEVAAMTRTAGKLCEATFERVVVEAQRRGEVGAHVDARTAGRYLLTTLQGLRVSAKAGAAPEALRAVAGLAIAGLRAL